MGVKVYGRRPSMLIEIRKTPKDANMRAHLWPSCFSGRRSCCVNRPISQFCRVNRRLSNHRGLGVGKKIQGRRVAMAIRGMPRSVGLRNWSKKLGVMVRFRV